MKVQGGCGEIRRREEQHKRKSCCPVHPHDEQVSGIIDAQPSGSP